MLFSIFNLPALAFRYWKRKAAVYGVSYAGQRTGHIDKNAKIHPSSMVVDCHVGNHVTIDSDCVIVNCKLKEYAHFGKNCQIYNSRVDSYSYAGFGSIFQRVNIGKFCSMGAYVLLGASGHPFERVTTHPFTYLKTFGNILGEDDSIKLDELQQKKVNIGHDVWIGHQVVVLPGITISDGAVVGAGTVVSRDVGPYEVVVGNPAKAIRKRFPDNIIEKLAEIQWWNWDRDTIRCRIKDFNDPGLFVEKYG